MLMNYSFVIVGAISSSEIPLASKQENLYIIVLLLQRVSFFHIP